MSTAPRRILIDDADSTIHYGPGWFPADTTQLDGLGNFGPVHAGTSHATTIDGSSLSFNFSGTSIAVFGTIAILNSTGVITPTWTCLVDGMAIPKPNPTFNFFENGWNLCEQPQLPTGEHTLIINVQTPTGRAFYIDYLLYTPTEDVDLDGAVIEYRTPDASVSFQSEWQLWNGENLTQSNGASVALNFHGTAVTLLGDVPAELPHKSTGASYSIDSGASTFFTLAGLAPTSTTTLYQMPILKLTGLSPAAHTLVITYRGDSTHTALSVLVFYVTNAVVAAVDPPPPPSATSASGSTPLSTLAAGGTLTTSAAGRVLPSLSSSPTLGAQGLPPASRKMPIGMIVGPIIGGLALIALLTGAIFWCRRRRQCVRRPGALNPFLASEAETCTVTSKSASASSPGTALRYTRSSTPLAGDTTQTSSGPQRRSVLFHQTVDRGVRIPMDAPQSLEPEIFELPPEYSRD